MPFQYTPYRNEFAGTIGELMRAGPEAQARAAIAIGNAQAQGAVQAGNAWAGGIQNIAQAATGAASQIAKEREEAPIRAQQAELRTLQLGEAKRQASSADQLAAMKRQVGGYLNDPDVINPDGTFNLGGMTKKLSGPLPNGASGPTETPDITALAGLLEPINQHITQARESQRVYAEHQTNALARLASGVLTLGAPSAAQPEGAYLSYATVGVAAAVKAGLMTQPQADQFLAQVAADPERALKGAAMRSTVAPIKLGKDDRLVSGIDPTQTIVGATPDPADKYKGSYTGPDGIRRYADGTPITGQVMAPQPPAKAAPAAGSFEDYVTRAAALAGKTVAQLSPADIELARKKYQQADDRPQASVTIRNETNNALANLPAWALDDTRPTGPEANAVDPVIGRTPNGLYQDAVTLIQTGAYPSMGRTNDARGVALRTAIDAKVGAIAASSGMDVPQLRAFFKSNQASLTAQQKLYDAAAANIATADRNADLLAEALTKMPDSGSPLLNQSLRAFQARVAGDPAMAAIGTYLASVQNEYGKLITSASGTSAALTEGARHEAQNLINPDATVKQMLASIAALKAEGGNRLLSTGDQIKLISGRMTIGGAKPGGTGGGPDLTGLTPGHGRTFSSGPYMGQTWTVGPDGQPKRVS
jgi:hypothetical protein